MKPSRLTALSCWCRPAHSADVEGFGPLQQQRKSVPSWFCCSVTFPLCGFKVNVLILWTNTHPLIMQALVALQCSVCCKLARRCLTLGWWWWTDQSPTSALRAPPSCTCLFFEWTMLLLCIQIGGVWTAAVWSLLDCVAACLIQAESWIVLLCRSKDAFPEFELRVELWSCALEDELTLANTPKKLAKKLRSSFGRSAGKKLCPLLDSPDPDTFLQYNPIPAYVC